LGAERSWLTMSDELEELQGEAEVTSCIIVGVSPLEACFASRHYAAL